MINRNVLISLSRSLATASSSLAIPMSTIALKIEFGGGLELLFSKKRSYQLTLPAAVPNNNSTDITTVGPTRPIDIAYVIRYLTEYLLKEREELFVEKGTV